MIADRSDIDGVRNDDQEEKEEDSVENVGQTVRIEGMLTASRTVKVGNDDGPPTAVVKSHVF